MASLSLGVGLMLGGTVYGKISNLIQNGDFSNGLAEWDDVSSHYSVVSGRAYHPPDAALKQLRQSPFEGTAQNYRLAFDCEILSGRLRVQTRNAAGGGTASLFSVSDTSVTSVVADFTTTADDVFIMFARHDIDVLTEFYIDNVVLSKV